MSSIHSVSGRAESEVDKLVGFRFHPTDEEIIRLLQEKRLKPTFSIDAISDHNIYDYEPSQLSNLSRIQSDEKWSSFFCAPKYMKADAKRVKRATKTGYWKATGEIRKIKEKRSNKEIGSKRILVFYERHPGYKEIKTHWVMHQYSAKDNPLYKEDFVVCRIKRKRDKKRCISTNVEDHRQKKPRISTVDEDQPSQHMAFHNGSLIARNMSLESQLLLPSNCLLSNTGVTENTSPESQLPSLENTSPELQLPSLENTSPESQLLISENTSPESQLPVLENTSPESQLPVLENTSPESQLPVAENISPESQLSVAENIFPEWHLKSQLLPSNFSVFNPRDDVAVSTLQVDPQHLARLNAIDDCNVSDQCLFSLVELPITPEQGSAYSCVSSDDDNVLLSLFDSRREDNPMNPQGFVSDKYPCGEAGHNTLRHDFNSPSSVAGLCGGDRSEIDTETFSDWVKNIFKYNTYTCVNHNEILYN